MLTLLNKKNQLALLLGAAFCYPAAAGPDDGLHAIAGLGYFHDDNLFRLPDGVPGYDGRRSDAARSYLAGLTFDKRYSRQEISARATVSKVKFNHFDQLDYDGKDLQFNWKWHLLSHWDGNLGTTYAQTLAPYTDFRSSERNLRTQRHYHFDGGWRMHPSWRVRGGAARDKFEYELPVQRVNNRSEDTFELGFDYLPKSESTAGLVARKIKGRYQNLRALGGMLQDDSFDQDELKARIFWNAGGSSNVQMLAGYARRKHRSLPERDASGFNGRVTAQYAPRGKMSYTAAAWREFSAVESNVVSDSLNRGASLAARYDATAKLRLDASLSYEKRRYNARIALATPQDLDDSLKSAQLSATWQVRRTISLSTSAAQQVRSGSPFLGLGKFKANTISFNANAQF